MYRNKLESLTTTLAQMKTERIKQENRLAAQEQGELTTLPFTATNLRYAYFIFRTTRAAQGNFV